MSIRRRALDLVYALVNETNITTLTKELIDYLAVSDLEFKTDLTKKICELVQRYAPSRRYHVDTLLDVFKQVPALSLSLSLCLSLPRMRPLTVLSLPAQAGEHVKDEQARAFVALVSNTPELTGYTTRALYRAMFDAKHPRGLLLVGVWCLGEYGDSVVTGGGPQPGEAPLAATADEVRARMQRACYVS